MHVYKSKRVPLLHFSALCDIFRKRKSFENFKFFSKKNVLRFLSLIYGADFRLSRLVFLTCFSVSRFLRVHAGIEAVDEVAVGLDIHALAQFVDEHLDARGEGVVERVALVDRRVSRHRVGRPRRFHQRVSRRCKNSTLYKKL